MWLSQMKRLPVQHNVTLGTEERKLPNGNCFYLPTASLDMSKTIDLSNTDQEMFANFLSWVENYNSYITFKIFASSLKFNGFNSCIVDFFDSKKEVNGPLSLYFNPPYNTRLNLNDVAAFYSKIGSTLKHNYTGTQAWLLSANLEALKHVGLRPSRKIKLF